MFDQKITEWAPMWVVICILVTVTYEHNQYLDRVMLLFTSGWCLGHLAAMITTWLEK